MAAAMGGGGGVDGSRSMGCGGDTLGLDALGGIGNLPMSKVCDCESSGSTAPPPRLPLLRIRNCIISKNER